MGDFVTDRLHLRAAELLSDGEWHPREPVIRELSKLVPPGLAMRRYRRDREASLKRRKDGADRRRQGQLGQELHTRSPQRITVGQRRYAVQVLAGRAYEERGRPKSEVRMVKPPRVTRSHEPALATQILEHQVADLRQRIAQLEAENAQLRREIKER